MQNKIKISVAISSVILIGIGAFTAGKVLGKNGTGFNEDTEASVTLADTQRTQRFPKEKITEPETTGTIVSIEEDTITLLVDDDSQDRSHESKTVPVSRDGEGNSDGSMSTDTSTGSTRSQSSPSQDDDEDTDSKGEEVGYTLSENVAVHSDSGLTIDALISGIEVRLELDSEQIVTSISIIG